VIAAEEMAGREIDPEFESGRQAAHFLRAKAEN